MRGDKMKMNCMYDGGVRICVNECSGIQVEIVIMCLDCQAFLELLFGSLFFSAYNFCFVPSDLMLRSDCMHH